MRDVIPGNEAIISLSDKGQIYIPSGLLKLWELSAKSGELQILVNRDGSATIRPVDPETKITYSYLLELNEDLLQRVSDAYKSAKNGHVLASEEDIDKYFRRLDEKNKKESWLVKFFKKLFVREK